MKEVNLNFEDNSFIISYPKIQMKVKDLLYILEDLSEDSEIIIDGTLKIPVNI